MAIFERLGDLIRANVNDMIDKAENPEKMCKLIIIDMEEQLNKSVQAYGQALGSEKQIKKQLEAAKQQSESWNEKAKMALTNGNEELAKQALNNKIAQDKLVAQYAEMDASVSAQVESVRVQVETLKAKLEEARSKQALLIARSQMADVKKDLAKATGNMDSSNAFAKMDKMEQKISAKEAEADAFAEISGSDTAVNDPFAKLEADSAVNAELERLKAEMGN